MSLVYRSNCSIHYKMITIVSILGEDGSLKPGLLEYLVDGIIPLLYTYYSCFFSPSDAPSHFLQTHEITIAAQIFNKLLVRNESNDKF